MSATSTRTAAAKVKPARKGTARTSAGKAAPVKTRTVSPAKAKGTVKLGKPTARKAAPKPPAKGKAKATKTSDGGALSAERVREISAIGKLRAKGMKWEDISAETGVSLSALARMRLVGKREGIAGFTR